MSDLWERNYPMRRTMWLATAGLVAVAMIGCGPQTHFKRGYEFTVQTEPSGAQVYVDGEPKGDSPTQVTLEFEIDLENPTKGVGRHFIFVQKAGYEAREREVRATDPTSIFFILDQD